MKIKAGVVMPNKLVMRRALIVANSIWNHHNKELVVTCGMDGEHSAGSLHYYGYAIDLRTNYFSEYEKQEVAAQLKSALPEGFDVIVHSTHIHIEYDKIILEEEQ